MTTGAQLTFLEPGLAAGALENSPSRLQLRLCGSLIRRLAEAGGILSRVPNVSCCETRPRNTDPPDSDSQQADSDAKFGCRRIRTGDNPDNASADYSERNEIRQYPVVHAEPTHIKPKLQRHSARLCFLDPCAKAMEAMPHSWWHQKARDVRDSACLDVLVPRDAAMSSCAMANCGLRP